MSARDDRPSDPGDEVAALLRLAGRRPAVPDEVAARVREAAHRHWRRELQRRARVRFAWAAAGLAAAASIVLVVALQLDRAAPPASIEGVQVEALAGRAWSREGRWPWTERRPLQVGAAVSAKAELATGEDGRAAVRLASGHSVRLDAGSRIRLLGRAELALDRGAVYVDSGPPGRRPAAPLRIATPLGEVQETGTQYEVRLGEGSVRLRVREGAVVLQAAGGPHPVGVAAELEVREDGAARTRPVARHGADWDWIAGVTPLPALDGLSARAFLHRVAREGGWTLRFADREAARIAGEAVLRGSVAGLTPGQALAAVLPTCGLAHRFADGELVVSRAR
jgi:ferric-dicitrate binding protein FerR (iron transport regulator)